METMGNLDVFLNPKSVAVIGASEREGSWGSYITLGLLSGGYPGKIFPVSQHAGKIYGIPAYRNIREIKDPIDLAILTIPEHAVEKTIEDCGHKQVKGISIVTAGYSEALEDGKKKEEALTRLARSFGVRLLGPNVSGTFDLYNGFNGSAAPEKHLLRCGLAAISQGGYAFYDLIAFGFNRRMGIGKFVHTGNECDLTASDFLELFGGDPQVQGIVMYLEAIRDGRRFFEIAREVSKIKPIVVYKAGRTKGSARAAQSHTGALCGSKEIHDGLFHQVGVIVSPTMEMLIPIGHALMARPPMRGKRVGILPGGGSYGVSLSDSVEEEGLLVPELSPRLQASLRSIGMPPRASTRNPVDVGASDLIFKADSMLAVGREILTSGEVDALAVIGMGRPGILGKDSPNRLKIFLDINKKVLKGYHEMEKETGVPVLISSIFTAGESQIVHDLTEEGIQIYNRIDETAKLLFLMHEYWVRRSN